jgi:tetratricopeptide (TPR) repeat protein
MSAALSVSSCRLPGSLLAGVIAGTAALLLATAPAPSQAQAAGCGNPFVNHFGPFDYRRADQGTRDLVEKAHFTPGVEMMMRPATTMMREMAGDVRYTLNVFPNHHRALLTMQRLSEKHGIDPPPSGTHTVECWYQRAVLYAPDDTVVRALFAQFLAKRGRKPEASFQLQAAVPHAGNNPLSHYNIGLVAFEIGNHELALSQAHRAIELGFERRDLADRLRQVNRWVEPAAPAGG